MNLSEARNVKSARRQRTRVGRGRSSGHGHTCGRGDKGWYARSGAFKRRFYQGGSMPFFRRIPKFGFNNKAFKNIFEVVNVDALDRAGKGGVVTPAELAEKGFVSSKLAKVKILGRGEVKTALTVKASCFSEAAKAKIEAAGGKAEMI